MALDGPIPVIIIILAGLVIIGTIISVRLKHVQREISKLGEGYYEKERVIMNRLKSGSYTRDEYQREHERLVSEMREESRKLTD